MTPDKSKTMDAAEKLMLDLMEKHPGASESSLLALFQNVARQRTDVLRAIVGNFMKHSSDAARSSQPVDNGHFLSSSPNPRLDLCRWSVHRLKRARRAAPCAAPANSERDLDELQ